MTRQQLFEQIKKKQSYLCVGLDTDLEKIPKHLLKLPDPIFEFNKQIIDATKDLCVAYKPNLAFYESIGPKGMISLEKTINYIPKNIFTIADAKRGDIGNTSEMYARAREQEYHEPFSLPKRWLDGQDKLDPKTPFNFVSTADTIGGNSGSPVLNRAGEFVGINFDRNRHGLVRNFVYTEEQARHISVHSRAVLEALRKLYDAEPLAHELLGQ